MTSKGAAPMSSLEAHISNETDPVNLKLGSCMEIDKIFTAYTAYESDDDALE